MFNRIIFMLVVSSLFVLGCQGSNSDSRGGVDSESVVVDSNGNPIVDSENGGVTGTDSKGQSLDSDNPGDTSGAGDSEDGGDTVPEPVSGEPCGYKNEGEILDVSDKIQLCMPPIDCTTVTCPPDVGDCVDGKCVYKGDYKGIETLPEAWATHYCDLSGGTCHGVTQFNYAEITAGMVATNNSMSFCTNTAQPGVTCVGIVAIPPVMVGTSQVAATTATWGTGLTEASGLCYELEGPTGGKVLAPVTDRCGGWCTCGGSGIQECGGCIDAVDMQPNCACVGAVPGLYSECCGIGDSCGALDMACDWCASNNHPHFDFDKAAFIQLCGDADLGSCKLETVKAVPCIPAQESWPPGCSGCLTEQNKFCCVDGTTDPVNFPEVPDSSCCCTWGKTYNANSDTCE